MNAKEMVDLSLMSWNILAPCWVEKVWYPSSYKLAADYQTRINKILSEICLHNCDIVFIQEAQEDHRGVPQLRQEAPCCRPAAREGLYAESRHHRPPR